MIWVIGAGVFCRGPLMKRIPYSMLEVYGFLWRYYVSGKWIESNPEQRIT